MRIYVFYLLYINRKCQEYLGKVNFKFFVGKGVGIGYVGNRGWRKFFYNIFLRIFFELGEYIIYVKY